MVECRGDVSPRKAKSASAFLLFPIPLPIPCPRLVEALVLVPVSPRIDGSSSMLPLCLPLP